jgi:hypothetical protein
LRFHIDLPQGEKLHFVKQKLNCFEHHGSFWLYQPWQNRIASISRRQLATAAMKQWPTFWSAPKRARCLTRSPKDPIKKKLLRIFLSVCSIYSCSTH